DATSKARARDAVLGWAASMWPGLIPKAAFQHEAFEHDQPGLKIMAASGGESGAWAFRSEHISTDGAGVDTIVTEATIAHREGKLFYGVRTSCSFLGEGRIPYAIPAFMRDFASQAGL